MFEECSGQMLHYFVDDLSTTPRHSLIFRLAALCVLLGGAFCGRHYLPAPHQLALDAPKVLYSGADTTRLLCPLFLLLPYLCTAKVGFGLFLSVLNFAYACFGLGEVRFVSCSPILSRCGRKEPDVIQLGAQDLEEDPERELPVVVRIRPGPLQRLCYRLRWWLKRG